MCSPSELLPVDRRPGWKVCSSVEMTVPVVLRPSTHISSVSWALEVVVDLKKPMSSSV